MVGCHSAIENQVLLPDKSRIIVFHKLILNGVISVPKMAVEKHKILQRLDFCQRKSMSKNAPNIKRPIRKPWWKLAQIAKKINQKKLCRMFLKNLFSSNFKRIAKNKNEIICGRTPRLTVVIATAKRTIINLHKSIFLGSKIKIATLPKIPKIIAVVG